MKRLLPFLALAAAAVADTPELLSLAREAQGGAEVLDAVRNVQLEGRLTAGNVVYRYVETWTDEAIVCVYKTRDAEVTKGWDGTAGWIEQGSAVAMEVEEAARMRDGLALRKLLLLRFPEEPSADAGALKSGTFRIAFGDRNWVSEVRFAAGEDEAVYNFDEYAPSGKLNLPLRWRASVKGVPAASATWRFTRAVTNVELPEGFFAREVRRPVEPGHGR